MIQNIAQSVRYIGVDDLDLDLFESQYVIPEGMAYNSYLLEGEKLAVLDTVDERKAEAWKANLSEALAGRKPDYLVVHHLEPDHSGLVGWMLTEIPVLKIALSAKAARGAGELLPGGGDSLQRRRLREVRRATLNYQHFFGRFFSRRTYKKSP